MPILWLGLLRLVLGSIAYNIRQWGRVTLHADFVSNGSFLPFDKDLGSNMAALLHQAKLQGAEHLGLSREMWVKHSADRQAYLHYQERRQQGIASRQIQISSRATYNSP